MKLLVQQFLETHTFQELQDQYGVFARFHQDNYKFSLTYGQIEAKESDLLSQECRGLILSSLDGKPFIPHTINTVSSFKSICPGQTKILSFPMRRFFNHNQEFAATINWKTASILEKLDGTMCAIYYDPFSNEWNVSTRSSPSANIPLEDNQYIFRTLFEKALLDSSNISFNNFTNLLDKNITYVFELTSPYNKIVVHYDNCAVTLLAARDLTTHIELDISTLDIVKSKIIREVKKYSLSALDEIINFVCSSNPVEHEGVVIKDSDFNRIKIKNPAHGELSKCRDSLKTSDRNCLMMILNEKDDDVAPFLPQEVVKKMMNIKSNLNKLIHHYDGLFIKFSNLVSPGDKRSFAQLILVEDIWTDPLFRMFDKKANSMKDYILKNKKLGVWADQFLDNVLFFSEKL